MSRKNFLRGAGILAILLCLTALAAPLVAAPGADLGATRWMGLGEVARVFPGSDASCLESDVPGPGVVMVEVASPSWLDAEPMLVVEIRRQGGDESPVVPLVETATSRVLAFSRAAEILVCVGGQDPREVPDEIEVRSAFVELAEWAAKDGEDPEEDEPDPTVKGSVDGEDPEEDEPDPTRPLIAPTVDEVVASLCRRVAAANDPADDHADGFLCATPLVAGRVVRGRLDAVWHGDEDVLSFVVDGVRTMRIRSAGAADFGALYNAAGDRLRTGDGTAGGSGTGFRIVKTLGPGRYFVRVSGRDGAVGPYRLVVEPIDP